MIWKMAWRNVWRNKRRTLITASTLMIGVAVMSAMFSLVTGMNNRVVRNVTQSRIGEAQIHHANYRETQDEKLVIEGTDKVLEKARSTDKVKTATPRTIGLGMLAIGDRSRGVTLLGIDPVNEQKTTNWGERLVKGEYIDAPGQIMLGAYQAEKMEVELGAKMVLTVANVYTGEATTELVRVKGLLATGDVSIDRQSALVHIDMAQRMMGTNGKAHEIAMRLDVNSDNREEIAAVIEPLKGEGLAVEPWQDINLMIAEMQRITATFTDVMIFALFFILSFGIINTLSMSLLERMKEFGVMRALGTSGKSLAGQITAEALYIGLIGAVPGVLLGLLFSYLLATYGFSLGETTAYGMSFSEPIYGEVHPLSTLRTAVIFTLLTAAVSLFTALRASRLDPVEAMRR